MTSYRIGLLLVTLSAIAWSTAGLFTRLIPLDSGVLLFWRGTFGALGIAAAMLVMDGARALGDVRRLGVGGWLFALVSAAGMVLFIGALKQTTVAHVAVIYAAVPLVAAGLAWLLLGERPGRSAVLASVAALAGVCLMAGLGGEGSLGGDALALGMTVCMAAMMIIARTYTTVPVAAAACLSAAASAVVCVPFADVLAVSGHDLALLALFGLMNSALGMVMFTFGARLLPPVETALIGALDAPLAPLWVWLFVHEVPGAATLAGAAMVFAAVATHIAIAARRSTGAISSTL